MPEIVLSQNAIRSWIRRACFVMLTLFPLGPLTTNATESPRPVFIRASCVSPASSVVISSLKEGIRASQKYRSAATVDDNGRMDVVLTIYAHCTERDGVIAIATAYGVGQCSSATSCHGTLDGSTIKSALCDSRAAADCGRTLFNAFEDYASQKYP